MDKEIAICRTFPEVIFFFYPQGIYKPARIGNWAVPTKFKNLPLFQNRTIKELLWGYRDSAFPLMKLGLFTDVSKCSTASYLTPFKLDHFFSLYIEMSFPQYNKTKDGLYTVYTGKDDISKVATIDRWRQET